MRYFLIYADQKNPQPRFLDWYEQQRPGNWWNRDIYDSLEPRSHFKVELNQELEFMDLIQHPYFMVSKEFASLIQMYDAAIAFKMAILFDKKNKRTALYQIPRLPVVDCLSELSELSRDKSEIEKGVLLEAQVRGRPIFRIKGVSRKYVVANLELVESAYRRKVMGMRIQEFIVQ